MEALARWLRQVQTARWSSKYLVVVMWEGRDRLAMNLR